MPDLRKVYQVCYTINSTRRSTIIAHNTQHLAHFSEEDADDGAEEDSDGKVHDVGELACDERCQHERERDGEQPLVHAYRPRDDLDGTGQEATSNTRNEFDIHRFMICCTKVTPCSHARTGHEDVRIVSPCSLLR